MEDGQKSSEGSHHDLFHGQQNQHVQEHHRNRNQRPQPQSPQSDAPQSDPSERRHVCLFGLSADPPTGAGGHFSIVQALCGLRRQPHPPETNGTSDFDVATRDLQSTALAPAPEASTSTDGECECEDDDGGPALAPYMFDEVWVLPVYRHTFQEKQSRLASFQHRLRMCELAFQDAGEPSTAIVLSDDRSGESYQRGPSNSSPRPPRVVVSDAEYRSWEAAVEAARAQTSPDTCPFDPSHISVGTASLLRYLQGEHPDVEFHFCLGEDSFWDLVKGKWKESGRVLSAFRNKLWVVPRTVSNDERTGAQSDSLEAAGVGARILHVPGMTSVSSSRVRACRSVEELKGLVKNPVLQYMEANGLYSFETGGAL